MFHPELVEKAMDLADALCDLRRDYPFWMCLTMLSDPPRFDKLDSRYTQEHFDCAERIREKFRKTNAEGHKRPENQKKSSDGSFSFREMRTILSKTMNGYFFLNSKKRLEVVLRV